MLYQQLQKESEFFFFRILSLDNSSFIIIQFDLKRFLSSEFQTQLTLIFLEFSRKIK